MNYIFREGERGFLKFVKGVSFRGFDSDLYIGGGGIWINSNIIDF